MGSKTKKPKAVVANDTRASICQTAKSTGVIDQLIGLQLRKIRKERNLSQEDIALHLQMSHQQVQKYESGRNRISASTLYYISVLLNRPINDFFQLVDNYLKELKD